MVALYLRRYYIYLRGNHYIKLEGCPLKIKVNKRIRDIKIYDGWSLSEESHKH